MNAPFPRRVATALLEAALSIAPHDSLEWGHAMLSELRHVEGSWPAFFWSLGGAGVLAKHALVTLILPGRNRTSLSSAGDFFSKEGPMRKPALLVTASCVLASLLFFLVPVFRQAFQVSLAQWHYIFHVGEWGTRRADHEIEALGKKAEASHDAEALAIAAFRHPRAAESARLVDEAVRINPKLTWAYAVVAVKWSTLPEMDGWVSALEKYDPQNALPYLIVAETSDIAEVTQRQIARRTEDKPRVWQEAMSAAFQAPKLDTYSTQLMELHRRVVQRYALRDPFLALAHEWYGLPSYAAGDSGDYAKMILGSGQTLEAKGDYEGARGKYLAVARFVQTMSGDKGGVSFFRSIAKEDYDRLGNLAQLQGNHAEAVFYGSLAEETQRADSRALKLLRNSVSGSRVARWNALLVRLSGVAMLLCAAVLLACLFGTIMRIRSLRLASLHPSSLTLSLAFSAAVGTLVSSAVLLVSYRPYAEIIESFITKGDESGLNELAGFLGGAQIPLGTVTYLGVSNAVFHFWLGITALCCIAAVVALFRHWQSRTRNSPA